MTNRSTEISIQTASITDRGLNERRPLNEDSMLSDPVRRIFAVADGVGGAEAGEVASKTAVEVLDEAFRHHHDEDDYEDLMEIAIQRANASIYRMSREQPRLSMMATTIVALHLDGLRATVGHVGDSRLYRLLPDGRLQRETDDHSVVEEEVRAGRMTAAQAANHPSRNVISRALGAESSVEVDMKTIEVEPGCLFLLCSDGITRHIPDEEINSLLRDAQSLEDVCAEMKRRCYERGAEDNLTAVLVRVGGDGRRTPARHADEDEQTLIAARPSSVDAFNADDDSNSGADSVLRRPFNEAGAAREATVTTTAPLSAAPASDGHERDETAEHTRPHEPPTAKATSGSGVRALALLLVVLAAALLAFYVGWRYGRNGAETSAAPSSTQTPVQTTTQSVAPTATPAEDPEQSYLRRRRAVDIDPVGEAERMARETNNAPLDSDDPEFLYLYGRAMLMRGKQQEAVSFFEKSIRRIEENQSARLAQLKFDARLATVAAHLRSNDEAKAREALILLDEFIRDESAGAQQANVAPPATTASPF